MKTVDIGRRRARAPVHITVVWCGVGWGTVAMIVLTGGGQAISQTHLPMLSACSSVVVRILTNIDCE